MPVAAAVVGTTLLGAYSANKAASKMSDAAKKQISSTNNLANQARLDAQNLYSKAGQSAQAGIGGAVRFYQQNAEKRNAPLIQGNMMAQNVLGQGAQQANNAILGLPVDMSFANMPQQVNADYSGINSASLPILGSQQSPQQSNSPIISEEIGRKLAYQQLLGGK